MNPLVHVRRVELIDAVKWTFARGYGYAPSAYLETVYLHITKTSPPMPYLLNYTHPVQRLNTGLHGLHRPLLYLFMWSTHVRRKTV